MANETWKFVQQPAGEEQQRQQAGDEDEAEAGTRSSAEHTLDHTFYYYKLSREQ